MDFEVQAHQKTKIILMDESGFSSLVKKLNTFRIQTSLIFIGVPLKINAITLKHFHLKPKSNTAFTKFAFQNTVSLLPSR